MNEEFDALLRNNIWSLVSITLVMHKTGCMWVFRLKSNASGNIERHKAHLVAKGFHQQPSIHYDETYNPIIKPQTICLLLSVVVTQK